MIYVIIIISVIAIIISSVGIITSINFQKQQKEKYNDLEKLINENKNLTFNIKDGLSEVEISKIDPSVDVNLLMDNLYQIYLDFINKTNKLDLNFDDVLTFEYKDIYVNRISNYIRNGYKDIIDNINLIGYSISEFNNNQIKFRINISCYSYKTLKENIVSGSNIYKVEHIDLVTYKKVNDKWLISYCDTIYENKLSN